MFDYVRSSYRLGPTFTDVVCQTKDIERTLGGTMSNYWIDPSGQLWYIGCDHVSDFQEIGEDDERYDPERKWKNFEWVPNGNHGKVSPCLLTDYITIYPDKFHGPFEDWPTCRIHFVNGKLRSFALDPRDYYDIPDENDFEEDEVVYWKDRFNSLKRWVKDQNDIPTKTMKFTTTVQQYNDTQDLFLEIPHYILQNLDWEEGDDLAWSISQGKIILTKVKDPSSTEEEPTMSDYDWYTVKEEAIQEYLNSESEGKECKDYDEIYDHYIQETNKETFGEYYHSPEAQGSWQTPYWP